VTIPVSSSRRRLSGFSPEYALLGFLDQAPAHGYELHQKLLTHLGEIWHASLSQTYNILNRLERRGFIEGTTLSQERRPDRREFHLTASGKERYEAWLESLSPCSVRAIRVEFLTKLFFLERRDPAVALQAIDAQTAALQEAIDRLRQKLRDLPVEGDFNYLGLSLRLRQLETLVDWLRECKVSLARGIL